LREEQLWRDKNFLREVIDINPCLIFVKDSNSRFTLVNKNVADLYGMEPRALIGKTDAELSATGEQAQAFRSADLTVIQTQQELLIPEERLTDARGAVRLLQTIKRPIMDRDGKTRLVLGVSTDITARKKAELEIERQRNELAHLSRITMLSELSGSLAHELNQPLAAILANAQAAQRFLAKEPPNLLEVREILHDIIDDDRHAGGVIQGLRLLLKKGEMRQEVLDLNEALQSVLKLVRSDLLNAGVSVHTELGQPLPKICGDRVQLQQVLINLVINASEAMSDRVSGQRLLTIRSGTDNAGQIWLAVSDRGRGIDAELMEHLFTPFYSTKEHGLGIGLSVCRRIIAAHGGELLASNNDDVGACFRISLPALKEENS
jgi:two-component system, LuxR family, sensor kinase FixL